MSMIDVESAELRQQSDAVNRGAATVDETVQQLTGQVRDLSGRWRGSAAESFQSLWDEWQRSATQLHEAMTGIGDFLRQAADTYENAEDSIKSSSGR
ncbi:WXG100 family type VII secretion target [Allocatelliglobosispora scoriae]|uniref:ESAT-6-like protein n=1 Tax=Allocatelliglobosispora scoriae TaxID=643052 RepID=A0A841BN43_9ACTN|nr:WXG100 family type VII secretion target [Allocatelliglobosispora scoriae]MBB5868609.1 WXG100 family type VII secretion target [Allocatelliglobosispora scoriae]